jgi:hypothetical protein
VGDFQSRGQLGRNINGQLGSSCAALRGPALREAGIPAGLARQLAPRCRRRDGWWQAQVAEANGGTIIISYTLRVLLDELDDLLGGQAAASTPS